MSKTPKTLGLPVNQMTLAASDGDLHLGAPDGRGRSSDRQMCKVASWAVGFERLLEDPTGIEYFTAFLKSEVSAENILFWQACEKFQKIPASQKGELKHEARFIYDEYLSNNAFHAINIDDTARIDEKDLEDPKPDMFQKAQQQIFKLMKFDSYTRFVRSPLYQSCMLADVEGRSLPDPKNPGSAKNASLNRSSIGDSKKQLQKKAAANLRKSLPFDVEDGSDQKAALESRVGGDKRGETRGSWGEVSERGVSRNESQCSVKSTGSADGKVENGSSSARETARAEKYCCVYLPDGTASLAPTRSGLMIREMLTGLCEKRGFALSDVRIYLQGKDKQPLSLDQDSFVLKDQQVSLELRVKITLEVVFTGATMGIVVKSSKTLLDALSSVLQKHGLRPQDVVVTTSEKEPLTLNMNVFSLAGKKLQLNRVHGTDQNSAPSSRVRASAPQDKPETRGIIEAEKPPSSLDPVLRTKNCAVKKNDMDGLLDLLSRASCQVDDQRGLLTKEHLVLPDFLQLPKQKEAGSSQEQSGQGSTRPAEELAASPAPPAASPARPATSTASPAPPATSPAPPATSTARPAPPAASTAHPAASTAPPAASTAPQVATDASSCSRPQSTYKSPRNAAPTDTRPGCPPSCTDSSRETAV